MLNTDAPRIVAVVVAHNRRDLLRESLDGIAGQDRPVDAVVVVDNASSDDSADVASAHALRADVVRLDRNTGGAGGFAIGIARALERHEADAVWLMDDDTVPMSSALDELIAALTVGGSATVLAASRAVWTDGVTEHPMNRPRRRPGARVSEREEAAGLLPIRSASFVSLLIVANAVRRGGLPIADYFIWNDDFEYTLRLLRHARGYYARRSVVMHKTLVLGSSDTDPGERFFYEVRNKLWLFRFGTGFGPLDRPIYALGTARRWIRTLIRSRDRTRLLRAARRGLVEGLHGRPRATVESLADLGEVARAVARVESRR